MSFWNNLWHYLGVGETNDLDSIGSLHDDNCINPANGLPMVGGCGGFDLEGNTFGMNHDSIGFTATDTSFEDTTWQDSSWSVSDSDFGSSFGDD